MNYLTHYTQIMLSLIALTLVLIIHMNIRSKLTKITLVLWIIFFMNSFFNLPQLNFKKEIFMALVLPFALTAMILLGYLVTYLGGTKTNWKLIFGVLIGGFVGTVICNLLKLPTNISIIPIDIGVCFAPIYGSIITLINSKKRPISFGTKWFSIILLAFGCYTFLPPFISETPGVREALLTVHLGFIFGITILLISLILEKTAEENTKMREKLKYEGLLLNTAKMSALGEMAAGVAHEINNPLAIAGLAISQIAESVNDETNLSYIEKANQGIFRAAKIVNALKIFSRTDLLGDTEGVNLKELVENVLFLCRQRFIDKGIKIAVENIDAAKVNIKCNQSELSQVYYNVLSNAFDALQHSEEKNISISFAKEGNKIQSKIMNTGQLIPAEDKQKLFQPFFTTKEVGHGTGLALSISKRYLEKINGTIYLDDKEPHTTFVVEIST